MDSSLIVIEYFNFNKWNTNHTDSNNIPDDNFGYHVFSFSPTDIGISVGVECKFRISDDLIEDIWW